MKKNLHAIDRIVRWLFAIVVLVLYLTNIIGGTLAIVLGVTAIILATTALINFCPIYYILGISTRKKTL